MAAATELVPAGLELPPGALAAGQQDSRAADGSKVSVDTGAATKPMANQQGSNQ